MATLRPGQHGNILDCSAQDGFPNVPDFRAYAADGIWAVVHVASQGTFYRDPLYNTRRVAARGVAGLLWGACHIIDASDVSAQVAAFIDASEFTAGSDPFLVTVDYADIDEPAALHQLRDFVAQVDRALPSVSCVVRGSALLRLNLAPSAGGYINPAMTGVRDFFAKHRLWVAEKQSKNIPWPWDAVFLWGSDVSDVHRFYGSRDALAGKWLA